jgi:restriction endonuclease S subunit
MDEQTQLPEGWQWVKLGEVVDFVGGGTPSKSEPKYWNGDLHWCSVKDIKGNYLHSTEDTITEAGLSNSAANVAAVGELILVTRITPGKCVITNISTAVNQDLKIVRPRVNISIPFLKYYFDAFAKEIIQKSSGTTVLGITLNNLKEIAFPLVDYDIQNLIVKKIEELSSELDKGVESLLLAQQQLATYRQAVLKWAFEGRLTNDLKDGELPAGWTRYSLKEVCQIQRGKSQHRPRNEPSLYGGKYPFVQTGDIRNSKGSILQEYSQTYSEKGLTQSRLWPKGTLCITIAANIGETAILGMDACFPDSVVGLICDPQLLLNKFLHYFFVLNKTKLEQLAPATAQKNINVDILEKFPIYLPQTSEQAEMISKIEERFSLVDSLEQNIEANLQYAKTLRASILKKAFEGKLFNEESLLNKRINKIKSTKLFYV